MNAEKCIAHKKESCRITQSSRKGVIRDIFEISTVIVLLEKQNGLLL